MTRVCVCLLLLAITFSSCQKLLDYYNIRNAGNKTPDCRVATIKWESEFLKYNATFSYNEAGLPEKVTEIYNTGLDDIEEIDPFEYDDQNRLLREGPYSTFNPNARLYEYEGNSPLPVRATLSSNASVFAEEFEYDQKGRMIQLSVKLVREPGNEHPNEPAVVTKFYYDQRGNRQFSPSNAHYPGLVEYSDKPSLYSLNKIWQIVNRDFSKNATLYGETFNEHGLPLKVKSTIDEYFQHFFGMEPGSILTYECHDN